MKIKHESGDAVLKQPVLKHVCGDLVRLRMCSDEPDRGLRIWLGPDRAGNDIIMFVRSGKFVEAYDPTEYDIIGRIDEVDDA